MAGKKQVSTKIFTDGYQNMNAPEALAHPESFGGAIIVSFDYLGKTANIYTSCDEQFRHGLLFRCGEEEEFFLPKNGETLPELYNRLIENKYHVRIKGWVNRELEPLKPYDIALSIVNNVMKNKSLKECELFKDLDSEYDELIEVFRQTAIEIFSKDIAEKFAEREIEKEREAKRRKKVNIV